MTEVSLSLHVVRAIVLNLKGHLGLHETLLWFGSTELQNVSANLKLYSKLSFVVVVWML